MESVLNVCMGGLCFPSLNLWGTLKIHLRIMGLFVNTCQFVHERKSPRGRECVFPFSLIGGACSLSEHSKRHASVSDGGWLSGLCAAAVGT